MCTIYHQLFLAAACLSVEHSWGQKDSAGLLFIARLCWELTRTVNIVLVITPAVSSQWNNFSDSRWEEEMSNACMRHHKEGDYVIFSRGVHIFIRSNHELSHWSPLCVSALSVQRPCILQHIIECVFSLVSLPEKSIVPLRRQHIFFGTCWERKSAGNYKPRTSNAHFTHDRDSQWQDIGTLSPKGHDSVIASKSETLDLIIREHFHWYYFPQVFWK